MNSFPRISELPAMMNTKGWSWIRLGKENPNAEGFWVGEDLQGNRWLTKLRGARRAYREIVFAKLAQNIGWSCQSSMFLQLDAQAAKIFCRSEGEIHACHWFFDEHVGVPCGTSCALHPIFEENPLQLDHFDLIDVPNLIDWPKCEIATYIFGGHEPPGTLFTSSHELVVIDSELMFSSAPSSFGNSRWIRMEDDSISQKGQELAVEVCCEIAAVSSLAVDWILSLPNNMKVEGSQSIAENFISGIRYAKNYAFPG